MKADSMGTLTQQKMAKAEYKTARERPSSDWRLGVVDKRCQNCHAIFLLAGRKLRCTMLGTTVSAHAICKDWMDKSSRIAADRRSGWAAVTDVIAAAKAMRAKS